MKKEVGAPAIIVAVLAVIGLVWLLWSRMATPAAPVVSGAEIQPPSGRQINPADLPPGGAAPGGGPGGAPAGGTLGMPPGK